jgi:hypothetical protein
MHHSAATQSRSAAGLHYNSHSAGSKQADGIVPFDRRLASKSSQAAERNQK